MYIHDDLHKHFDSYQDALNYKHKRRVIFGLWFVVLLAVAQLHSHPALGLVALSAHLTVLCWLLRRYPKYPREVDET